MADYVVLLHGAGRGRGSMWRMGRFLAGQGYQVVNLGYPSLRSPIENLSIIVGYKINQCCSIPEKRIHFVTHSLGGIIVRHLLKVAPIPNLGRVVMLAPPNQGTELADYFMRNRIFNWIIGPIGEQLGTSLESLPNKLGPVDYKVGVIAGNRSANPLFSKIIPGPDDGRISIERTRVDGMTDFLEVPCIHPLIMFDRQVIEQSGHFLIHGCFHE